MWVGLTRLETRCPACHWTWTTAAWHCDRPLLLPDGSSWLCGAPASPLLMAWPALEAKTHRCLLSAVWASDELCWTESRHQLNEQDSDPGTIGDLGPPPWGPESEDILDAGWTICVAHKCPQEGASLTGRPTVKLLISSWALLQRLIAFLKSDLCRKSPAGTGTSLRLSPFCLLPQAGSGSAFGISCSSRQ